MTDFPKFDDYLQIFRDEAVSRSQSLTVNAVDRDGSDSNIHAAATAACAEEVTGQLASVEEGVWLDSSFGHKLDRWAFDRYSQLRKQAAPAFVTLLFTTTAAAPSSFTIPGGTRVATSSGQEFLTVVSVPFTLGSAGPVQVLARSTLAGLDQNVGSGTITSITSPIANQPADLAVINNEASTGGDNVEQDEDFKSRIRRFWIAARRGTKGAIETGALAVPGVVNAISISAMQSFGYPARSLTLVISDRFTEALVRQGQPVPTYDVKSQALAATVQQALDEFRADGIPVKVVVAQVRLIAVVLRLRFQASVTDPDAVALFARTLIVQLVNQSDPGVAFVPADAAKALRSVSGLDLFGDEIASPAGPIVPSSPYQTLKTSLATVTTDSQATLQSQAQNP